MRGLILLGLLVSAVAGASAMPANAIIGFWRVANGEAIVQIRRDGSHYVGRLVWIGGRMGSTHNSRSDPDDQPMTDRHNPDPSKRDRPLKGLQLLTGLTYHVNDDDRAVWRHGQIYNAENGKVYHCTVRLADIDHLELHGFVGVPLFGETTTWRRVAAPDQPGL